MTVRRTRHKRRDIATSSLSPGRHATPASDDSQAVWFWSFMGFLWERGRVGLAERAETEATRQAASPFNAVREPEISPRPDDRRRERTSTLHQGQPSDRIVDR